MLGYSGNSSAQGILQGKPPTHNFYLVLKTSICLAETKLKVGWVGCETLVEPGKGRQQLVLEKRQKNSDLGVLAGQQGQPPADSVELEHKCFQISVARKQMTC